MTEVKLTWDDIREASHIGVERRIESRSSTRRDLSHVQEEMRWALEIYGAIGELAAHRLYGIPFEKTMNTWKRHDMLGRFEIRTTSHSYGGLLVRKNDRVDADYMLVIVNEYRLPTVRIAGVFPGAWAKAERFAWRDCWKVPQSHLQPLPELVV